MKITVFRVDDRLIHGQIVTAWLNQADAKQILCVDDNAAKDEFQKMLLEMATPKNVKLIVATIEEAKKIISDDDSDIKTLLLVKGTNQAAELLPYLGYINDVNIGNLNMKTGKTKLLSNVWVDQNDIEGFTKIYKLNKKAEVRAVPSDKSQDVMELLVKEKLL